MVEKAVSKSQGPKTLFRVQEDSRSSWLRIGFSISVLHPSVQRPQYKRFAPIQLLTSSQRRISFCLLTTGKRFNNALPNVQIPQEVKTKQPSQSFKLKWTPLLSLEYRVLKKVLKRTLFRKRSKQNRRAFQWSSLLGKVGLKKVLCWVLFSKGKFRKGPKESKGVQKGTCRSQSWESWFLTWVSYWPVFLQKVWFDV